jgi:hypothetical protein
MPGLLDKKGGRRWLLLLNKRWHLLPPFLSNEQRHKGRRRCHLFFSLHKMEPYSPFVCNEPDTELSIQALPFLCIVIVHRYAWLSNTKGFFCICKVHPIEFSALSLNASLVWLDAGNKGEGLDVIWTTFHAFIHQSRWWPWTDLPACASNMVGRALKWHLED